MNIVKSKIYETPDYYTDDNGKEVIWHQGKMKPVTFGWFDGTLYTLAGNPNKAEDGTDRTITHSQLGDIIMGELPDEHPKNQTDTDGWTNTISRSDFVFPGRLWLTTKVIAFWDFPDKNAMTGVLEELEDELNINILSDPDWRIEIVEGGDSIWGKNSANLIPISKYMGSERVSKSELMKQHELSPMQKGSKQVPKGIGSNSNKRKPLAYKQALQAESLQLDDLSNLLLEKLLIGEPVTIPELRDILNNKVLNFEFIKLNGEVRPAKGTTMMKYIPKEDQPSGLNSPSSDKVAAFYDLSKDAWRSVSNKSKEVILTTDEETGKPKIVISDKKPKEEKIPKPPTVNGVPSDKLVQKPAQPITKPSIVPDEIPVTPEIGDIITDEPISPLDVNDPDIEIEDVDDEDIISGDDEEIIDLDDEDLDDEDLDDEDLDDEDLDDEEVELVDSGDELEDTDKVVKDTL